MSGFHLPPITSSVVLIGQSRSSIAVSFLIVRHFFLPTCRKYASGLDSVQLDSSQTAENLHDFGSDSLPNQRWTGNRIRGGLSRSPEMPRRIAALLGIPFD